MLLGMNLDMIQTHTLRITPTFLSIIAEIDEFKGAWRALGTLAPERLKALRRIATIESIGSSTRIEGASLSDREVEALLGRLGQTAFISRDEQEVAGYAEVMDAIFESHTAIPLTENYVKQLHAMLRRRVSKDERHRGEYKKHGVCWCGAARVEARGMACRPRTGSRSGQGNRDASRNEGD